MAKVTGPAFSLDAQGGLGDGICFTRCMKGNRVILLPTHKDADSALQSVQRASFLTGRSMWRALSAASKAYWNEQAEGEHMTGYNLYIKKVLLGEIAPQSWVNGSYEGQVGASTDDCYVQQAFGTTWVLNLTTSGQTVGRSNSDYQKIGGGMRFLNVTIPAAATILTAHIHITGTSYQSGTVNSKIVGNKEVNPATFSNIANYQARRGTAAGGADNTKRTVAEVAWDNVPTFDVDVECESPDISAVVQELVDQAGYASGQAMALFWDDHDNRSGLGNTRTGKSYNGSTTKCAKLHVTYKYLA